MSKWLMPDFRFPGGPSGLLQGAQPTSRARLDRERPHLSPAEPALDVVPRPRASGRYYVVCLLVGSVLSYFHFPDGFSDLSKVACWEAEFTLSCTREVCE